MLLTLALSPLLQDVSSGQTLVVAPRSELPVTTTDAKVTVVTGEELEETGERSLPRALGQAAGVWIQESNLGGGAPVIRGLLGNQILVLIDGIRVNDSTTRFGPNQSLNTIDPAIVDRVEIIHGSSSVLYGSDAIGGVVAIWTRRRSPAREGGDRRPHVELQGLYDSSTDGGRASVAPSVAGRGWGLLGIVSGEDWGDLEAGEGEEQEFTGYDGNAAFGSFDVALGPERTLRAMTMVNRTFDVPRTFQVVPGFGQDEARFQQYDFKLQDRRWATVTYDDRERGGVADRMQLRVSARRYTEQRERRRSGSDTQVFSETQVDTVGLGADWSRALGGGHRLTWGFDLDDDDVDSFGRETDLPSGDVSDRDGDFAPNARYTSFGAFVQDEVNLAPTFLTLGLRWSFFDFAFDDPGDGRERGDFDALTASLEAAHDLSDEVRLTATLAQGFQAPNLEDLANDGDFAGGTEVANPDLDPAQSLMAELAVEVVKEAWSATAAVFATRIDDYIGRRLLDEGDPNTPGDELYLRENAGHVALWGAEVGFRRRLGWPGSPWSLEGLAAWVRGRQYDDTVDPNTGEAPLDGVELRRVPPLNGHVAVWWRSGQGPSWLDEAGLTLIWAMDQEELHPEDVGDPRIDPNGTEAWSVVNLDFGGPLGQAVRWNLTLVNVFDELYRVHGSAIDGPGRSVVIGMKASF